FAGYGILVLVFLGTMAIAWRLGRRTSEVRDRKSEIRSQRSDVNASSARPQAPRSQLTSLLYAPRSMLFLFLFAWLLAVEIGVEAWYRMHERTTIATPAWSVRWPEDAPGYREI